MTAWQGFSRFLGDRRGNFGMMTAILLPVLLGAGGMAMDVTNMMISKTQLQDAADAAALAASTALAKGEAADEAAARKLARDFFIGQISNSMGDAAAEALADAVDIRVTTTAKNNGKSFKVQVGSTYGLALTPLMGVLGYKTVDIAVNSASTSGISEDKTSVSMFLVLDRSGSMDERTDTKDGNGYYIRKLAALKTATATLLKSLNDADPTNEYVRTGAVSFNQKKQNEKSLNWGTTHVSGYVNGLTATGTTNSGDAMKTAYALLADPSENEAHDNMNEQVPKKYIVLMTDGENNVDGANRKTREACTDARSAKMEVYSIALMVDDASARKLLEDCATNPKTHYFRAESASDLIAAFDSIGKKAAPIATRLTH